MIAAKEAISFIICVKDDIPAFKETLMSVTQIMEEVDEVIVVDGSDIAGSKNVKALCFENKSRGKIVYKFKAPAGVYNAINTGCNISTREWINVIHSGDIVVALSLHKIRAKMRLSRNKLIMADQIRGRDLKKTYLVKSDSKSQVFHHQSIFYRRSLHDHLGVYSESLPLSADQKFFSQLDCHHIDQVDEVYCFFNTEGISSRVSYNHYVIEVSAAKDFSQIFIITVKFVTKRAVSLFGREVEFQIQKLVNWWRRFYRRPYSG